MFHAIIHFSEYMQKRGLPLIGARKTAEGVRWQDCAKEAVWQEAQRAVARGAEGVKES